MNILSNSGNGTAHFKNNVNNFLNTSIYSYLEAFYLEASEAVFLVMCDPSMNEP